MHWKSRLQSSTFRSRSRLERAAPGLNAIEPCNHPGNAGPNEVLAVVSHTAPTPDSLPTSGPRLLANRLLANHRALGVFFGLLFFCHRGPGTSRYQAPVARCNHDATELFGTPLFFPLCHNVIPICNQLPPSTAPLQTFFRSVRHLSGPRAILCLHATSASSSVALRVLGGDVLVHAVHRDHVVRSCFSFA